MLIFNKKERVMKKEAKVEYGIQIVKPWSKAMYDHNEDVAEVVKTMLHSMWSAAMEKLADSVEEDEDGFTPDVEEFPWNTYVEPDLSEIQSAVTGYGFGNSYTVGDVGVEVEQGIDEAPLYRLNEIAEELGLELEKGFIGFN